jgi:5-formyltetrahydrofolate cyclo-ligase
VASPGQPRSEVRGAAAAFDPAAYDEQRLAADAAAMERMREVSAAESAAAEVQPEAAPPGAWKWEIRKQIWDMMEEQDLADFPRPGGQSRAWPGGHPCFARQKES